MFSCKNTLLRERVCFLCTCVFSQCLYSYIHTFIYARSYRLIWTEELTKREHGSRVGKKRQRCMYRYIFEQVCICMCIYIGIYTCTSTKESTCAYVMHMHIDLHIHMYMPVCVWRAVPKTLKMQCCNTFESVQWILEARILCGINVSTQNDAPSKSTKITNLNSLVQFRLVGGKLFNSPGGLSKEIRGVYADRLRGYI